MRMAKHSCIGRFVLVCLTLAGALLPTAVPSVAAGSPAGSGPDDATTPPGDWVPITPAEEHWYAFQYSGDGSQVLVRLQVEPDDGAGFAVWTPENINQWRLGLEAEPIGRGAVDASTDGLVWSGNFHTSGSYYVVVMHSGNRPETSYYLVEILGEGVSLDKPTQTETATPVPVERPSKPQVDSKLEGRLVFQTTFGGVFYTVNADGSGLTRITNGIDPVWSPDGRQIAFTRWNEPRGVWVVDANGGGAWRAFDWAETRWPNWSPDGARLLFSRQHGGRTDEVEKCFWKWCFTIPAHPFWKLGVVRLQDGDFREPSSSDFSLAPGWSPDGTRIVYADEHGLRVQSEDGDLSYFITQDGRDTSPAWSPNGQRVAFTRRQHDHWEVYVVDADGRNLARLTDTRKRPDGGLGNSAAATWSPDGSRLAFLTDRAGAWQIWVMRADGSGQQAMFDSALDDLTLEYGSVGDRAISWTR